MLIQSLNHITLAVKNIDISLEFYKDILDFVPDVRWDTGAYLHLNDLWLCLSVDDVDAHNDYTHLAFTIKEDDLSLFLHKLNTKKVPLWKQDSSEGASVYFLDPDGHKLEVHSGDLQSRLDSLRKKPYKDLQWFE